MLRRLRSELSRLATLAREDVAAACANDPAARGPLEVALLYPGVHALWAHRVAHALWGQGAPLAARALAHASRFVTGVEIHPGATIGRGVFIDHGMGVVIGETATVGDRCLLYKGVVLGGTSLEHKIRHPQIGSDVVIGSNACVLGHISVGDGARIGSGSVVVRAVPAGATVVGVPGRVVTRGGDRHARLHATLDHANLPDPVSEVLRALAAQNERLSRRLEALERELGVSPSPDSIPGDPFPPNDEPMPRLEGG
jgi:serine O-acetyltransferase